MNYPLTGDEVVLLMLLWSIGYATWSVASAFIETKEKSDDL